MPKLVGAVPQGDRVIIDWQAYYVAFVEKHGEPVVHNDRLLFRDGWQYGRYSYQGPEYPPPDTRTQRRFLQQCYWDLQIQKLTREERTLANHIDTIKKWNDTRSMTLKTKVVYKDRDDKGNEVTRLTDGEDVDLTGLEHKLLFLQDLLAEAKLKRSKL
jgi:hypothetical protein